MYEQKDIVLMPFPYTDLTGKKSRPALIISNKKLNTTDDRLCVLITSKQSPDALKIQEKYQEQGTLPLTSFVKPHRIFTINTKIIQKKLCSVSDTFYKKIVDEINTFIQ